jgi:hypothetical protein
MAVRLSALRAGRALPQGRSSGTHFCKRLSEPQGPKRLGKLKNSVTPSGLKPATFRLVACILVTKSWDSLTLVKSLNILETLARWIFWSRQNRRSVCPGSLLWLVPRISVRHSVCPEDARTRHKIMGGKAEFKSGTNWCNSQSCSTILNCICFAVPENRLRD